MNTYPTHLQATALPQGSLMSIDQMTAVENLMQLGFTVREADFLYLVGTNCGVFTTEHYRLVTGIAARGRVQQDLIRKLDAHHFITRIAITQQHQIIHLRHKAFYRAILAEDSRLRRGMSPGLIRQRLQYMDYLARNPQLRYITTEGDRHRIFTSDFAIAEELIPQRIYRSKANPNDATIRLFPERFPIFVGEQDGISSLGVVYGEDPADRFRAFRRFILAHEELFGAFANLRFVYVSPSQARATLASTHLRARFGGTHSVQSDDLQRYFSLRLKLDHRQENTFTDDDYAFWTRAHRAYKTPSYEPLYAEFLGQNSLPSASLVAPRQAFQFTHFVPSTDLRERLESGTLTRV